MEDKVASVEGVASAVIQIIGILSLLNVVKISCKTESEEIREKARTAVRVKIFLTEFMMTSP